MHNILSLSEREKEKRKTSKQVSEYKYGEKLSFMEKWDKTPNPRIINIDDSESNGEPSQEDARDRSRQERTLGTDHT